jgi:arylsulfatase A-like enzyme
MNTGLYPTSHGVVHGVVRKGVVKGQEKLPASMTTLAEQIRKLGYRTYGVTANLHLKPELGFGRGFDLYACLGGVPAEKVNESILAWKADIEAQEGPVFIWLHYFDPHRPYHARDPWVKTFLPDVTSEEMARMRDLQRNWPNLPRGSDVDRLVTVARAFYDSEIRHFDEHLKQLFRDIPLLERCWALITSDHGEEFREHGSLGHSHNLYNQTVRIPFLIRMPLERRPRIEETPVSLVDVAPTLISVAGGRPQRSWAGASLIVSKRDSQSRNHNPLLAELDRLPEHAGLKSIIDGQWKLIGRIHSTEFELFDLKADPGEMENLAASEPEVFKRMRSALVTFTAALPAAPDSTAAQPISAEEEEILRGLGYVN